MDVWQILSEVREMDAPQATKCTQLSQVALDEISEEIKRIIGLIGNAPDTRVMGALHSLNADVVAIRRSI